MRPVRWFIVLLVAVLGCASAVSKEGDTTAEPSRSDEETRCWRNADCSSGERCIVPDGALQGVCGQTVDDLGLPDHSVPMPTDREETRSCSFDTDCPPLFACKKLDALHGACVKR
jgi:hypothetical protein